MVLPRKHYTVQQLVSETKNLLEASYPDIWVEGEVSDLAAPPSGHRYFSLKDANAVLRCVLFRNRAFQAACAPANGMQVLARGRLSIYVNRGDMQFVVSYVEEAGEGALRRAFEMLKRRLDAEGLFAAERKRQLPILPRCIGVVTSDHGAAVHDVLVTLQRRYPRARVILYPVTVQGDRAAGEITTALGLADTRQEVDLLLLVRGGGSLQDLQAFNEESVARAVSACSLPVVTGIGHETDFTIADFVADMRAPTPTGAAEAATPEIQELNNRTRTLRKRLTARMTARLATLQQQLDLGTRRLAHPRRRLEHWARHHRHLQQRLQLAAHASIRQQLLLLERSAGALGRHS
ncbi:MAG: exodeoxyribonuclease VII large subunit, partial [Pseudomonadota bacterium]|nr:exodeoxyribonuclease VII large subunit [Pseudomonadota bacterium]